MDLGTYILLSDYEFTPERIEAIAWLLCTGAVVGVAIMVAQMLQGDVDG